VDVLRRLANYTAEQTRLRLEYKPVLRVHLKAAGLTELCTYLNA
jgi:hypothetical protein